MGFKEKYPIRQELLPSNSKRRGGSALGPVRFIVAHDTGNPSSTAANNVTYYKRTSNDTYASAHIFVDGEEIVECIPAFSNPEKAWHVLYDRTKDNQLYGCDANDNAIGVELCFGGRVDNQKAYHKYVWVMAYLCNKYGLDPLKDIVGHYTLDPSRKTDPMTALKLLGKSFNDFLADVKQEVELCTEEDDEMQLSNYQWAELTKVVEGLLEDKVITSSEWVNKAKNKTLTLSEMTWLNSIVLSRIAKGGK